MKRRCDFAKVTRWALVALATGLVLNAIVTVALWQRATANHRLAERSAVRAVWIAEETQRKMLVRERVCSQSNQGEACRALFDRLAHAATPAQKLLLACEAIEALREKPPRTAHCPRIR